MCGVQRSLGFRGRYRVSGSNFRTCSEVITKRSQFTGAQPNYSLQLLNLIRQQNQIKSKAVKKYV